MEQVSYPLAPTPEPLKGTLLDVARVEKGVKWLDDEIALYDSYNCMSFENFAEWCAPNEKSFTEGMSWEYGFRFTVYGGVVCKSIGLDQARMESEVRKAFERGESRAIERAFMENRFAARGDEAPGDYPGESNFRWDAAVDINPEGPLPLGWGLAQLEAHAAAHYNSTPTIHMSRACASALMAVSGIELVGSELRTKLGSKIAAGGGYDYPNLSPTGTEAIDGQKWMYASGEVLVLESDLEVRQIMAQDTNEVFVLAERSYVGAVDCYTSAVRVEVES